MNLWSCHTRLGLFTSSVKYYRYGRLNLCLFMVLLFLAFYFPQPNLNLTDTQSYEVLGILNKMIHRKVFFKLSSSMHKQDIFIIAVFLTIIMIDLGRIGWNWWTWSWPEIRGSSSYFSNMFSRALHSIHEKQGHERLAGEELPTFGLNASRMTGWLLLGRGQNAQPLVGS